MAVARVAARVREGGHNLPEDTIRRRYDAGLRNFFTLCQPMATTWEFWDNSGDPAQTPIASGAGPSTLIISDPALWEPMKAGHSR